MVYEITPLIPFVIGILIIIAIWDIVWKAIALWKSARNNQLIWFVCIAILNTAGILPIIYIFLFQKNRNPKKK